MTLNISEFREPGLAAPSVTAPLAITPQPAWQPSLAVCRATLTELEEAGPQWLSQSDAQAAMQFSFAKRRHDFLLGRKAAYDAIYTAFPHVPRSAFRIDKGVFEQPIWATPQTGPLCLSITHSHGIGAAVVSPAGFPMAVDIEQISSDRAPAMAEQMTDVETDLANSAVGQGDAAALTILWCAKEALSKSMGCGLTCPMHVLEVDEITATGAGWSGTFRNFFQYRFHVWPLSDDMLISVVMHRHYAFEPPVDLL